MKLELRQLRYVLALDRHRNFARAAEAIGLTQPALSRSIQALEDDVGGRLFDRNHARVEPTAIGARLIDLARPLLAQARLMESELQQLIGLASGLLRIGAGPFPAEISVGTAVGRLAKAHPGIRVDVLVADWPELCRQLLADELDVVVAETSHASDDERLAVEPLPEHRGVCYGRAGHPLSGKRDLTLEDVRRYPIALAILPKRLLDVLGKGDVVRRTDLPDGASATEFRVVTPALARNIVMESDVIGIATPRQLESDVASGRLVILPIAVPELRSCYGIIRLAHRTPSPAATAFLQILREVEREIEIDSSR